MENLSYKDIKAKIDVVKEKSSYKDAQELIHKLKDDQRKNVISAVNTLVKFIEKRNLEIERVTRLYEFDDSFGNFSFKAGVDEVGRGTLAGPIVAAAVILNPDALKKNDIILGIKDSKKLSAKLREELSEIIKSKALCWNICEISNKVIDRNGIAWCNNEVLKNASEMLEIRPDFIISDGYAIKGTKIENKFVIKGDSKSASVACASIIAKVYRDNLMKEFSKTYSSYGFENNAGYGTAEHVEAIRKYGITDIHRLSFLSNILEGSR